MINQNRLKLQLLERAGYTPSFWHEDQEGNEHAFYLKNNIEYEITFTDKPTVEPKSEEINTILSKHVCPYCINNLTAREVLRVRCLQCGAICRSNYWNVDKLNWSAEEKQTDWIKPSTKIVYNLTEMDDDDIPF